MNRSTSRLTAGVTVAGIVIVAGVVAGVVWASSGTPVAQTEPPSTATPSSSTSRTPQPSSSPSASLSPRPLSTPSATTAPATPAPPVTPSTRVPTEREGSSKSRVAPPSRVVVPPAPIVSATAPTLAPASTTPSASPTPTATPTPTPTVTATPKPTPTATPTPNPTPTPTPELTYTLHRSSAPTDDQLDAYSRIDEAMSAAAARYDRLTKISRHVDVSYDPSVATADANSDGNMRFGASRQYMVEGTALHELAHTLGVGTTWSWDTLCIDGSYRGVKATALLRSWDGADATLSCDHWHFWPYGLNYADEFSETAFDRNVKLIEAMRQDGLRTD